MNRAGYLLALAIGPVQPFVEAARRTRDLWYGSFILSEVAKAAAKACAGAGAELVFPFPEKPEVDLEPESEFIVANKIVAFCPDGDLEKAKRVLGQAKNAANKLWDKFAHKAKQQLDAIDPGAIDNARWNEQIMDVIELYSACKYVANESEFATARDRLDELLAARKNTRNFVQIGQCVPMGIPKSALDGARESVLKHLTGNTRRFLGVENDEALDATGVVKRVGGREERFTPLTRIAADDWLNNLQEGTREQLANAYQSAVDARLGSKIAGNADAYKKFPFDCQLLYKGRLERERADRKKDNNQAAVLALESFRKVITPIWNDPGTPGAYVALLVADGDHMGRLINKTEPKTFETQQAISRALARFAGEVRGIVRDHRGHAIYAGGDDVLAMLPVTKTVACARALADRFAELLKSFGDNGVRATLSVGVVIRHVFDPLGALRRDATRALRFAKQGDENTRQSEKRNALGTLVIPRSGVEIAVRGQWDAVDMLPLDARLGAWVTAFRERRLSSKVAYDLREVTQVLAGEPELSRREALRVLARKREGGVELDDALRTQLGNVIDRRGVATLVRELLIARRIEGLDA